MNKKTDLKMGKYDRLTFKERKKISGKMFLERPVNLNDLFAMLIVIYWLYDFGKSVT